MTVRPGPETESWLRDALIDSFGGVHSVPMHFQVGNHEYSRWRLGQDYATLLGSLVLTSLEQSALSLSDIPEEEKTDHAR